MSLIITEEGSFTDQDLHRITCIETPGMYKGMDFGVGIGPDPISNFPGWQSLFRPPRWNPEQRPRLSVPKLMASVYPYIQKFQRITANCRFGTDYQSVEQAVSLLRNLTADQVELVVSAQHPRELEKIKRKFPDTTLQHSLTWIDPSKIVEAIHEMLKDDFLFPGAEINMPVTQQGTSEIIDMVRQLEMRGHNSVLTMPPPKVQDNQAVEAAEWLKKLNDSSALKELKIRGRMSE